MLKKMLTLTGMAGLAWVLISAAPAEAGRGPGGKVKGQVIKVEQQQRTENGGELTQLTIRTRNGEQRRLHLGSGEGCPDCFAVGDRVQARLQGGQGANGSYPVQSMKVRRDGKMFGLSKDGSGNVLRQQGRLRDGSGAGQKGENQVRTRLEDGSNCNGRGPGTGQGGVNPGGGTRGEGGGGGRGRG